VTSRTPDDERDQVRSASRDSRHRDHPLFRRGRPRSIWSRKSPASCGASVGFAWLKPRPTGAGLEDTLEPYRKTAKAALVHLDDSDESESANYAVRATAADTDEDLVDMEADEAITRRALDLLGSRRNDAHEAALAADPPGAGRRFRVGPPADSRSAANLGTRRTTVSLQPSL
jgi:hypothetical protein